MRELKFLGLLVLVILVFAVNSLASTPEGVCPVWSQEEMDRIGTLGGDLEDYEYYYAGSEYFYDREVKDAFIHQAIVYKSWGYFFGEYYSSNSTTDVNKVHRSHALTEDEYNRCKQMLINHVTNPNP